jgi:hypothetical protein
MVESTIAIAIGADSTQVCEGSGGVTLVGDNDIICPLCIGSMLKLFGAITISQKVKKYKNLF